VAEDVTEQPITQTTLQHPKPAGLQLLTAGTSRQQAMPQNQLFLLNLLTFVYYCPVSADV
jgi:hypothetical protein